MDVDFTTLVVTVKRASIVNIEIAGDVGHWIGYCGAYDRKHLLIVDGFFREVREGETFEVLGMRLRIHKLLNFGQSRFEFQAPRSTRIHRESIKRGCDDY